jgi:hypothetical protein
MKNIILTTAFIIMISSSCKKDKQLSEHLSSLTVTNAVISGRSVKLGSLVTTVANNNYAQLSIMAGNNDIYIWPVGDSAHPYYTNAKFNTEERAIYSLFIAGQAPNISGIIVKDNIPYHTDSVCGVRIINLVPNSPMLNITLNVTPTVIETGNLAYLQYSDFKIYPAKATTTNYIFQIRKAADNAILTSYTLAIPRFANVTLVIRGLIGAAPAIGVTRVNNDR